MATAKKNELVTIDTFSLATPYDGMDAEMAELIKEQLEDLDEESGINCLTIKIPSGGNLAFTVQGDEDGNEEYLKDIEGVIIFTHRMNGYWPNAFGSSANPEDKIPLCSSMDGETGVNIKTGVISECEHCPYNQYGSDPNGGKGKACKNMRRIYLMRSGDPNIYLLTVPPTSIKEVSNALARIVNSGIPYNNLIVGFKLAKAANAKGISYATVTIDKRGILPATVAETAKAMYRQIKAKYKEMTITMDDYVSSPSSNNISESENKLDVQVSDAEFTDVTDRAGPEADIIPF
ncbi:MAG: hypothetical protein ACI4JC_01190 [Faecalibacterium sp.]